MVNPPPIITDDTHPELHEALEAWYRRWGDYAHQLAAYHGLKVLEPLTEVAPPPRPPDLSEHPVVKA